MRKIILLFIALLAVAAHAEQTYTLELKDGRYICTGAADCDKDDKAVFGGAVLWALEQAGAADKAKSAIVDYDAGKLMLTVRPAVPAGDYSYTFSLTMRAKDGRLLFLIEKIRCVPKGVLGGLSAISFDKVNLEKKPQQKEYIDRFGEMCDDYVKQMVSEVMKKDMNLTHWEAIVKGLVVKGMTENECLMAVGKPATVTENTQRVQWTYGSGMIVVFEQGSVTAVVK